MNAVIYARYSSDNQREESIEGQLRECTEYAQHNGMTILGTYVDRALSAKTADRPEFQRMVQDSAKGLFDVVIVWKLDRFSRDRYDSAHYKRILRGNGVKVVSAKENISEGPEGIILEAMLEGYAEYYSAELSQKIHRGQTENALKGKYNGGHIPLGYRVGDNRRLEIDPVTAPIIQEIFTRYAEGETVRAMIESFNQRGLKTKLGKDYNLNSFNRILKNRKYIGEYRYREVVIADGVPAIISQDLFDRVHERMEKNKRAPARSKATDEFLLTTKLFCGHCQRMMVGESGTSRNGTVHYYYKCGSAKRGTGCKKKAVRKSWMEQAVVQLTVGRVLHDQEIDRIADTLIALQDREDTTLPAFKSQLSDVEKSIENMLTAIQQGILTPSTKIRLESLEQQKEDLTVAIMQAQLDKPKYTKELIVQFIQQFKHGDVSNRDYQRRIIDTFVNAIYLFDDRLVITYNFKGGSQTSTIQEIEAAFGSDLTSCAPPQKRQVFTCRFFTTMENKEIIMADYKSMYYHLAGRTATAVDVLEMSTKTLLATLEAMKGTMEAVESTAQSLTELTEKLKLAQQLTEEMFIHCEDEAV